MNPYIGASKNLLYFSLFFPFPYHLKNRSPDRTSGRMAKAPDYILYSPETHQSESDF